MHEIACRRGGRLRKRLLRRLNMGSVSPPNKHGRIGFRRNFPFEGEWNGRRFSTKQIEAYAVNEEDWLVITVIVKFF